MVKSIEARAAESRKKIATRVVTDSFGEMKGGATFAKAAVKASRIERYGVFIDTQGVGYLRVEETKKGARYLINTGQTVEAVELDHGTIKSRGLEPAPEASILESAKILAQPLTKSVIISERSRKYLNEILNDKEIIEMATAKKTTKKAAAKKADKKAKATTSRSAESLVKFKKDAKEDALPKQALGILAVVKAAGELTVAQLKTKLEGKIETKQPIGVIWSFYKAKLVNGGYLSVAAAK